MANESETQGWEEAREIAANFGAIPSLFSACIRGLMTDSKEGSGMSRGTRHSLKVLMLGGNFRAAIYHAGLTFRPDQTDEKAFKTPEGVTKAFKLDELAYLTALLFSYRRMQKLCATKHSDRWPDISRAVILESEVGGHLGLAIPKIGFGWGILIGSIRNLAMGLLLVSKPKEFHKYRIDQKVKKSEFDLSYEREVWGCTHLQVASIILQTLGMGVNLAQAMELGFDAALSNSLATDVYRVRITREWISALLKTGKAPEMTHRGDFYPLRPELDKLTAAAQEIVSSGSAYEWLEKGKADAAPAESSDEEVSTEELKELEDIEESEES